jgi:hypothetical protein
MSKLNVFIHCIFEVMEFEVMTWYCYYLGINWYKNE